jgi:hypothetical protein
MIETKRRQGQKKPDGKTAIPKSICPQCGEYLQSCYMRGSGEGKRTLKRVGLGCPDPACSYIEKDFVELEDTQEGEKE